jgi:hypothetical protein
LDSEIDFFVRERFEWVTVEGGEGGGARFMYILLKQRTTHTFLTTEFSLHCPNIGPINSWPIAHR